MQPDQPNNQLTNQQNNRETNKQKEIWEDRRRNGPRSMQKRQVKKHNRVKLRLIFSH